MSGVPAEALAARFRGIVGWPYASPGSNDERGIDCSGAFVWAFSAFGLDIAHGSNTIFRKHCLETFEIGAEGAAALRPGMAVFKRRSSGGEPARYRGDGIGDMYHIGLVCGVSPLKIVHATPPAAREDKRLGAWRWAGLLAGVDYSERLDLNGKGDGYAVRSATATAESGNTVNMRCGPSRNATVRMRVPIGARVTVLRLMEGGAWAQVGYEGMSGYMMTAFLKDYGEEADAGGSALKAVAPGADYAALLKRVDALESAVQNAVQNAACACRADDPAAGRAREGGTAE